MKVNQKEVNILKVPWRIRMKRTEYIKLSDCLQKNSVDDRWLIPEGLLFTYKGIRQKISSILKHKNF